jgi:branched-chain amino acid transport system ATP-binding protein
MLELTGVDAGYGEGLVLRGIDLRLPRGSVAALLGPNGAGKTTLLRVASGLMKPTAGEVTVNGTATQGRGPHASAQVGVCHVPEGRGVFPNLTVRDNIVTFAGRGDIAVALDRAVEAFPDLGRRLNQLAGTMSGGQQQMLALSRAYVTQPRYVLLDEVSMGLAPVVVDEIFAFLRRLADGGAALLVVEQYVSRALELADYVYVLLRGEISFRGEPGELSSGRVMEQYLGTAAVGGPT